MDHGWLAWMDLWITDGHRHRPRTRRRELACLAACAFWSLEEAFILRELIQFPAKAWRDSASLISWSKALLSWDMKSIIRFNSMANPCLKVFIGWQMAIFPRLILP